VGLRGRRPEHAHARTGTVRGRRRPIIEREETQLTIESYEFSDYEENEENANTGDPIMAGVRHDFKITHGHKTFSHDLSLGNLAVHMVPIRFLQEFQLSCNYLNYFGPARYCARL
jgi:hypothetical protein